MNESLWWKLLLTVYGVCFGTFPYWFMFQGTGFAFLVAFTLWTGCGAWRLRGKRGFELVYMCLEALLLRCETLDASLPCSLIGDSNFKGCDAVGDLQRLYEHMRRWQKTEIIELCHILSPVSFSSHYSVICSCVREEKNSNGIARIKENNDQFSPCFLFQIRVISVVSYWREVKL